MIIMWQPIREESEKIVLASPKLFKTFQEAIDSSASFGRKTLGAIRVEVFEEFDGHPEE